MNAAAERVTTGGEVEGLYFSILWMLIKPSMLIAVFVALVLWSVMFIDFRHIPHNAPSTCSFSKSLSPVSLGQPQGQYLVSTCFICWPVLCTKLGLHHVPIMTGTLCFSNYPKFYFWIPMIDASYSYQINPLVSMKNIYIQVYASSTGRAHLLNDHYSEVTECMARLIKVFSHWFVSELAVVIWSMTVYSQMKGFFISPTYCLPHFWNYWSFTTGRCQCSKIHQLLRY